jgi:hypothetical protein
MLLPQISHETSFAFQHILDNLSFYVHSNHKCGMHMKMSYVVFDLLNCVAFMVSIAICYLFFLHVSTLCFIISQFVQCLLIFLILLCVFAGATCLVLYGIESAPLAFVVVMFFSHNIVASLCYCSVDHFFLVVTILKYDYKPGLNIVGTYKP